MTDWKSGDVIANGIRLRYHRTGGDKPPLVLAHGRADNGLCWSRMAASLESDYDVIMVDARGHGLSDAPENAYTTADHGEDLASVADALGLDRPAMLGHSMGGTSVAWVAANRPASIRCAVLEDPWFVMGLPLSAGEWQSRQAKWRNSVQEQRKLSQQQLIVFGRERSPTWHESEFEPWSRAKLQVSDTFLDWMPDGPPEWKAVVEHIEVPTLLVTADVQAGALVTPVLAEEIAGRNQKIRVVNIPGAGHSIHREEFDGFLDVVRRFLTAHYA